MCKFVEKIILFSNKVQVSIRLLITSHANVRSILIRAAIVNPVCNLGVMSSRNSLGRNSRKP